MPFENTPAAEVVIDEALIRRLLRAQHPDLAAHPLRIVTHGWDNVLARSADAPLLAAVARRTIAAVVADDVG